MFLKEISYSEFNNEPRYWELKNAKLNDINLIVGKNASGKSRTLNVISGLSNTLMSPIIAVDAGSYMAKFINSKNKEIILALDIRDGKVIKESLRIDNVDYIKREPDGTGEIRSAASNSFVKFKIPLNELVLLRKDEIQFPYLYELYSWAANCRLFRFSKDSEKNTYATVMQNKIPDLVNVKDTDKTIAMLNHGIAKFKNDFFDKIISGMRDVGYDIESVDIGSMESVRLSGPYSDSLTGLRIKEKDLLCITDQGAMSNGLFRALSIIIHFCYYDVARIKGTMLIDDIGEGLDYDRSTRLIDYLITYAKS
ncbi:MAG: ATP-binding protein [Fibrobacteres bacterium]|nr:ATP-binding protein [Fibrobacterota bacterium]